MSHKLDMIMLCHDFTINHESLQILEIFREIKLKFELFMFKCTY